MTIQKQDEQPDLAGYLDEDGHLHMQEEKIEFSGYRWEDWLAVAFFWLLCLAVFYQFFTRYIMEDSAAWTEEISRYLLIAVTFIASSLCVRKNTHIHLEFLFQFMPRKIGRVLSTAVDVLRVLFLLGGTYLSVLLLPKASLQRMIMFDISMGWVYATVVLGFGMMSFRAIQISIQHWKQGWSALERPMENI